MGDELETTNSNDSLNLSVNQMDVGDEPPDTNEEAADHSNEAAVNLRATREVTGNSSNREVEADADVNADVNADTSVIRFESADEALEIYEDAIDTSNEAVVAEETMRDIRGNRNNRQFEVIAAANVDIDAYVDTEENPVEDLDVEDDGSDCDDIALNSFLVDEEDEIAINYALMEDDDDFRQEDLFTISQLHEEPDVEENPIEIVYEEVPNEAPGNLKRQMRLVDLDLFIHEINKFPHNSSCARQKFTIENNRVDGFVTTLHLRCAGCEVTNVVNTNRSDANELVTVAGMNAGLGWTGLCKLFRPLGCPTIKEAAYADLHKTVGHRIKQLALASCREAAEKEKQLARAANMPLVDGIQTTTLQGDSNYSKRSRGTNYSSKSGGATLIGNETKKIVDFDVAQTYCQTCATTKPNQQPSQHDCPINFNGKAAQYEQELMARQFQRSINFNGMIISRFIADGDAAVIPALRRLKVYLGQVHITKILCRLHVLRNYIK